MKQVIDNFSGGAADYALFRPESPKAVFDFIYAHVQAFGTAWDCGTGNGQVAVELAKRFETVYATDISKEQLAHAAERPNIHYKAERAEATSLAAGSIDLITVAQAIHWFDFDGFYREVQRVARPGAFVAAWTYSLLRLSPAINEVIDHLYTNITRPYWDQERRLVDEGYTTIPFPFREVTAPEISIHKQYTFDQLIGYLGTWSGTKHYKKQLGEDPIAKAAGDLREAWGKEVLQDVQWPVHMRAGFTGMPG